MSLSKYLPSLNQAIQITIVFVALTVTGIGVILATKVGKLMGR